MGSLVPDTVAGRHVLLAKGVVNHPTMQRHPYRFDGAGPKEGA